MAKISETMRKKENNKSMEMENKRGRDKVNVGSQERSNPRTQRTDLVECERDEAVCRSRRA